jgi:hypothetical protein
MLRGTIDRGQRATPILHRLHQELSKRAEGQSVAPFSQEADVRASVSWYYALEAL